MKFSPSLKTRKSLLLSQRPPLEPILSLSTSCNIIFLRSGLILFSPLKALTLKLYTTFSFVTLLDMFHRHRYFFVITLCPFFPSFLFSADHFVLKHHSSVFFQFDARYHINIKHVKSYHYNFRINL
jgi:hypothetical protein